MKAQFIGTGAMPDIRNSASILINEHILFDIPNGNVKAMIRQGIDILKIDTVIISHTHADHCFDAPFLLWYKENYKKDKKLSTKFITDEVTKRTVKTLIDLSYFDSAKRATKEFVDIKELTNTKILNDLDIVNEPLEHVGIKYATGYILKDKKISIGLTGDTCFCQGVKRLASKVKYLIADMTLEIGDDSHMGIDNILELVKEYPKLKIIPIHMYAKTREKAKKLNIQNLIILEDGDILEL